MAVNYYALMQKVQLLTRAWFSTLLKKRLRQPISRPTISWDEILDNAIKMRATSMGTRVRFT